MAGVSRESGDVNELTRTTPLAADSNPVPPHFMSIIHVAQALLRREPMHQRVAVGLAGTQDCGRKCRLIWRVGIALGFQAECAATGVGNAAFARSHAIEETRTVKLKPRLIC